MSSVGNSDNTSVTQKLVTMCLVQLMQGFKKIDVSDHQVQYVKGGALSSSLTQPHRIYIRVQRSRRPRFKTFLAILLGTGFIPPKPLYMLSS